MESDFEFESLAEQNVNRMMDKFFGDKDPCLKAITKMNLLFDGTEEVLKKCENVLTKMKQMNYMDAKYIDEEMKLTYDKDGFLVLVNDIQSNVSKELVCKKPESKPDTDFISSNR
jgi:hypothetical protein